MHANTICAVCLSLMMHTSFNIAAADEVDWLRGTGKALEMRMHGKLVAPNGETIQAGTVAIHLRDQTGETPFEATVDGDHYSVWLPVNRVESFGLTVHATVDDSEVAYHRYFDKNQLAMFARDGLDLELVPPSRHVVIRVMDEGEPVANAKVSAQIVAVTEKGKTDERGIVRFPVYHNQPLQNVVAWTDDGRVGGSSALRESQHNGKESSLDCELHDARDQLVHVVDQKGDPVANVRLKIQVATPPPDYDFLGSMDVRTQSSGSDGTAIFPLFPDWKEIHCYVDILDPDWVLDGRLEWNDGVATQRLKPNVKRLETSGRIVGDPSSTAGLLVRHESFEHPIESQIDVQTCFTDQSGNFSLDLLPDATYVTYVDDASFVSPMRDWIPLPDGKQSEGLEITAQKGTPVTVIATAGSAREPIADATVSFRSEHTFFYGEGRRGTLARRFRGSTDKLGRVTANVPSGTLKVTLVQPSWQQNEEIDVVEGKPASIEIHRTHAEKQLVRGRVTGDGVPSHHFAGAKVYTGAIDGLSDEKDRAEVGKDGQFEFHTTATHFGVYVESKDNEYAGVIRGRDPGQVLELVMRPMIDYRGRLLNKSGKPIPNHEVTARIDVEGERRYDRNFVTQFDVREISVQTDEEGNYQFNNLPARLPISISTYAPHNKNRREALSEVFLDAMDDRPLAVSRIEDGLTEEMGGTASGLAKNHSSVLRDCRLGKYHLMVIHAGESEAAKEFVNDRLLNHRNLRKVARYMPLRVDGASIDDESSAKLLEQHNWPTPSVGEVFVAVYDADQKELGRILLDTSEASAEQLSDAFVTKLALEEVDAKAEWEEAFQDAEQTGRKVWAISGGRYCGPCIRLGRWLDDQYKHLEKDYVFFKVDAAMDVAGVEVAEQITRGGSHGIPFHAIFDPDQKLIVDSEGPTGNIGMPSNFEGIRHFKQMLSKTRTRLTQEQIDEMIATLGE